MDGREELRRELRPERAEVGGKLGDLKLRRPLRRERKERRQGRGALGSRRGRKGPGHRIRNALTQSCGLSPRVAEGQGLVSSLKGSLCQVEVG